MSFSRTADTVGTDLKLLVADTQSKSEHKVRGVLSKLRDILGRKSVGDQRELEKFKQDLYHQGVLTYCANTLKFNYAKIEGGYTTAAQMAEILSTCCVGLGPDTENVVFQNKFLPEVAENLLFLADHLMNRAQRDKGPNEMLRLFRKVFDSIGWLLRVYSHLIPRVLGSKHYESVQMCEDDEICKVTLLTWHDVLRANSAAISEMGSEALRSIMDDIVYKMASSSNPVIGGTAVKTLLLIINHHTLAVPFILRNYKGLDNLVRKDWSGKGFDAALDRLLGLLQSGLLKEENFQGSSEERVKAACVIQAAWKAYQTRKRMKRLPRAVSAIQRSFREKRRQQQEQTERRRIEEELRYEVRLRRQRAIRLFRQRQLHLLEILPAAQIERYLGEVENRAALLIQRVWRGHRERRNFQQRKYILKQHKAAVTLQRATLRFLKWRRAQRNVPAPWKGPKGLTDARRAELRRQVEEYIALHPSTVVSVEGTMELHQRAQNLLQQHLLTRTSKQREEQHRQALLAQINTDMELLLNAPSLKDATEQDSNLFLSRSAPVAARAKQSHNSMVQSTRLPWWRMLGSEFGDSEPLPKAEYEMEFETLYQGGSC
ncbi:IQ calmodulin-binding motif-containing protein 1 [Chanos chanos]|uniref:IQ calmodulin-binding motif-containing protein 1 n=1 Tax=Chanos chanos TaxID=29144 RepID=A0A6J2W3R5_CHACN|nr:IQ calmodulin-binding motif-containing protein 1 [Chanos chanos]